MSTIPRLHEGLHQFCDAITEELDFEFLARAVLKRAQAAFGSQRACLLIPTQGSWQVYGTRVEQPDTLTRTALHDWSAGPSIAVEEILDSRLPTWIETSDPRAKDRPWLAVRGDGRGPATPILMVEVSTALHRTAIDAEDALVILASRATVPLLNAWRWSSLRQDNQASQANLHRIHAQLDQRTHELGQERLMAEIATAQFQTEIDDHKLTTAWLRESQAKLGAAIHVAKAGSWLWQIDTGTLQCDHRTLELLGLSDRPFEGTYQAWSKLVHPADQQRVQKEVDEALETASALCCVFRVASSDDTSRTLRMYARVVRNRELEPITVDGFVVECLSEAAAPLAPTSDVPAATTQAQTA